MYIKKFFWSEMIFFILFIFSKIIWEKYYIKLKFIWIDFLSENYLWYLIDGVYIFVNIEKYGLLRLIYLLISLFVLF